MCAATRSAAIDRCPGTLALHRAQDGWLARIRIPGGRVTAGQLEAVACAAALGNGLVELTSRANLQLRGLPGGAGGRLAMIMAAAGLLPSICHDRARNVLASPLAGRHPRARSDTDAVVAELDRALCANPALAELSGRFLFAVDDGSGLALERGADVALIARGECTYALALAGYLTAEPIPARVAGAAAVRAAAAFLDERRARGAAARRLSELPNGAAAVARRLGSTLSEPLGRPTHRPLAPGRLTQRDGRSAVTALARLGRLDCRVVSALAALAAEVRVGSARTVTVLDLERAEARALERRLAALGLEVRAASGWAGLTTCAGLGRCAHARLDVAKAAAARARRRMPGAPAEHWAACERRCGERADQPVAVAPAAGEGIAVRVGPREARAATLEDALGALEG
jgi:sulfite reductase beta subunit-like hemoprotein